MNNINFFRFLAVLLLFAFYELGYSKCLPVDDSNPECRYEKGDPWCAQHGKGNMFAYSDDCLRQKSSRSGGTTADVSRLKALRQGMNYSEARQVILDAGWQGKNKRWQDVPQYGQVKDVYYNNGWHEVVDCAGTGTAPCRFEFNDIHGNTLVVITEGECYNDNFQPLKEGEKCDLGVSRWFLE